MLKRVQQIAKAHGEKPALIKLIKTGLSASAAEKMIRGDYPATRFRKKTANQLKKFLKRYDVVLNK